MHGNLFRSTDKMLSTLTESEGYGSSTLTSPATETYQSSLQRSTKSRKKVTTACESCKQRKVKCDGSQPCARCTSKLLQCYYSAHEDRRVRSAEKRRIKQLEDENQQLRDQVAHGQSHESDMVASQQPEALHEVPDDTTDTHDYNDSVLMDVDLSYDLNPANENVFDLSLDRLRDSPRSGALILTPGATRAFGNLPFSSAVTNNHYPDSGQQLQLQNFRLADWQILPLWSTDESPLGRAYTDFHNFGRKNPGIRTPDKKFDLMNATLLFRQRRLGADFDADGWASELQRSFVEPITQTVNVAGIYMLAQLKRWLLQPSHTTYAAIPDMIKPSLSQRTKTYPAFIDTVGIPFSRNAFLENSRNVLDAVTKAGLDVSWPYSVDEALVYIRPKGCSPADADENEHIYISPKFVAHVANPENWVFGHSISTEFSELADSEISARAQDVIRPVDRWL